MLFIPGLGKTGLLWLAPASQIPVHIEDKMIIDVNMFDRSYIAFYIKFRSFLLEVRTLQMM